MKIGNFQIDAPFFQAGLAGYSDTAMRLVARRHGCPYCITEAMLDILLLNGGKGRRPAELDDDDHPIAGQIMGAEPQTMARAADLLVDLGFDVIDVNLACPVKKIRKKLRGGHLLGEPEQAVAILRAVREAVGERRPCTVKLRRALDDDSRSAEAFHTVLQGAIDCGYAGAVVHARTVEQKYQGPSNWGFLRELVEQYRATPGFFLGGSGDIWGASDIFGMIEHTGVQLVSVARGCIGNPWIFEQARAIMRGDHAAADRPPTIFQQRDVLLNHLAIAARIHGEFAASIMMRKFGIRFSRHHPDSEQVRQRFIRSGSLRDWHQVVETWYARDGQGNSIDQAMPEEATPALCPVVQEGDPTPLRRFEASSSRNSVR
ncbi:MAG: tRNA-dihydrouridine synthase family protein [Phycisphaeraceae bacterium]|nr:tRNA-dihydrouridine synthase family protein [Phycisphaeraceae bacterium]